MMQQEHRISNILKSRKTVFIATLAVALWLHTTGYCEDSAEEAINAISSDISKFIFGATVRKVALTLGMGAGLFQAFMSGSIRPLLIYGGLGLAVCYLPKAVEWISKVA